MFDIGASELLLIVIVAILVIGPKDMPLALRTAGRWVGKLRRVSAHFRTGVDAMIREAEMEEVEKEWKERNSRIMAENPMAELDDPGRPAHSEDRNESPSANPESSGRADTDEPGLPLGPPPPP